MSKPAATQPAFWGQPMRWPRMNDERFQMLKTLGPHSLVLLSSDGAFSQTQTRDGYRIECRDVLPMRAVLSADRGNAASRNWDRGPTVEVIEALRVWFPSQRHAELMQRSVTDYLDEHARPGAYIMPDGARAGSNRAPVETRDLFNGWRNMNGHNRGALGASIRAMVSRRGWHCWDDRELLAHIDEKSEAEIARVRGGFGNSDRQREQYRREEAENGRPAVDRRFRAVRKR